jgi:thioredoxin-like negative regulator of GroEL
MIKAITIALALTIPATFALAAGSSSDEPPKKTKTSMECKDGQVWDKKMKKCLDAESSLLTDDARYEAARELAYAGQYKNAQVVLAAMSDQADTRVLTYYGFTHRKAGNVDLGMAYYQKALAADPNNLLARSYMGQGLVAQGDKDAARLQLVEINARGGKGTWPEVALANAIESGKGYSY